VRERSVVGVGSYQLVTRERIQAPVGETAGDEYPPHQ